ncbi:MAG: DUF3060 domain-containing protein [Kofleriaceae bacterium]|nr:DUF3060 domain-containing protein [Kofleriaceae bacterium]
MKHLAVLLVATLLGLPSLAMADAEYSDSSAVFTHDCSADATVTFSNASSEITVLGECELVSIDGASSKISIVSAKKVAINGASNEVTIDAVGKITVSGSANKVTYAKGLGKAKAPKVSKSGVSNKVSKRKVVKGS